MFKCKKEKKKFTVDNKYLQYQCWNCEIFRKV